MTDIKLVDTPGDPFLRLDLGVGENSGSITVTVSFDGSLADTIGRFGETEEEVRLDIAQDILYVVYSEFSAALEDAKSQDNASA